MYLPFPGGTGGLSDEKLNVSPYRVSSCEGIGCYSSLKTEGHSLSWLTVLKNPVITLDFSDGTEAIPLEVDGGGGGGIKTPQRL